MELPEVARDIEISEFLGVSRASLAQDRYRGRGIPYVRLGGRIRYLRADVLQYLAEHRVIGEAASA